MIPRILGIGTVSPLGSGVGSLLAGARREECPAMLKETLKTVRGKTFLPRYEARIEGVEEFISARALRRFDRFSKMALLAAMLAKKDANIEFPDPDRVGIVFGSGHGPIQTTFDFLDSIIDDGDNCASPTLFATSVHNSLPSQVSIQMKLTGPSQMFSAFQNTTGAVLNTARYWLESGSADYVLAGLGDEYCKVLGYSVAVGANQNYADIKPFQFKKCSYYPGEGFSVLLLGRESSGGYAGLESVSLCGKAKDVNKMVASASGVVIGSQGDKKTGKPYRLLDFSDKPVAAYSPLWGSFPACGGLSLALAAAGMREGCLFPSPDVYAKRRDMNLIVKECPLPENATVACVECTGKKGFDVITLCK